MFVEESFGLKAPGLTPEPLIMMYGPKITINLQITHTNIKVKRDIHTWHTSSCYKVVNFL